MGQQLNESQKCETVLWVEMTVCTPGEMSVLYVTIQRGEMTVSLSPREMTVLELDPSLRFKQASHVGIYRRRERHFKFLYTLFFSVPQCSSAAHC